MFARARLGARRDGGGAGLLQREHERGRRGRHVRDLPDGRHGRSRSDGPAAVRRDAEGRRDRGAGARSRALDRLERIGLQIMNRIGFGGPMNPDPVSARSPIRPSGASPRRSSVRRTSSRTTSSTTNREALDRIAGVLMEKKEIFGDELMDLLDSVGIRIPELDYGDEAVWPAPFFASLRRRSPAAAGDPGRDRGVHEKPLIDAPIAKRIDEKAADDDLRATSGHVTPATGAGSRFIYVGLAAVLGLGLGALVVVLSDTDHTTQVVAQHWSDYHPDGSTNARAARSPQHVSQGYRSSAAASSSSAQSPVHRSSSPTSPRAAPRSCSARSPSGPTFPSAVRSRIARSRSSTRRAASSTCSAATALAARSPPGSRPRNATFSCGARRSSSRSTPSSTSSRVNSVVVFLPPPPGGETRLDGRLLPPPRSRARARAAAERDARQPEDAGRRADLSRGDRDARTASRASGSTSTTTRRARTGERSCSSIPSRRRPESRPIPG